MYHPIYTCTGTCLCLCGVATVSGGLVGGLWQKYGGGLRHKDVRVQDMCVYKMYVYIMCVYIIHRHTHVPVYVHTHVVHAHVCTLYIDIHTDTYNVSCIDIHMYTHICMSMYNVHTHHTCVYIVHRHTYVPVHVCLQDVCVQYTLDIHMCLYMCVYKTRCVNTTCVCIFD